VPEDFEMEEDRYIPATVLDISKDCSAEIQMLRASDSPRQIVVNRAMVEEVSVGDKSYYVILENYVIGFLRGPNEA